MTNPLAITGIQIGATIGLVIVLVLSFIIISFFNVWLRRTRCLGARALGDGHDLNSG